MHTIHVYSDYMLLCTLSIHHDITLCSYVHTCTYYMYIRNVYDMSLYYYYIWSNIFCIILCDYVICIIYIYTYHTERERGKNNLSEPDKHDHLQLPACVAAASASPQHSSWKKSMAMAQKWGTNGPIKSAIVVFNQQRSF